MPTFFTDVQKSHIVNMDETPCYFDLPSSSTVETKGSKTVSIATSGYEKMRFTTVLAVSSDGGKLKPMLIFLLTFTFPVECGRAVLQRRIHTLLPSEPLGITHHLHH